MDRKILPLVFLFFTLIFFPHPSYAWWNSSWQYRRNITITLSGEPYTRNFEPVEIFVNASSWTSKPYNDSIRIINKPCGDDTGVEIPSAVYNITQTNGVMNSFTVAFEANTTSQNTTYCMYYDTSSKGNPNYPNFIQVDWSNYQIANKYLKLDLRGNEVSTFGGWLWINLTQPTTNQTFPTNANYYLGLYSNGAPITSSYWLKPEYSYVKYQNPVFVRVVVYYNTTGTSYMNATIDLWANSKDIILGKEFGIVDNTNPTYKMLPYNDVDLPGGTWSAGYWESSTGTISSTYDYTTPKKWIFDWVTFSSPRQNAGLCFVQPDYSNTSLFQYWRFWSAHDDGFSLVAGAVNTKARFIYRVTSSNDYTLCQDAFNRFTNLPAYSIGAEQTPNQPNITIEILHPLNASYEMKGSDYPFHFRIHSTSYPVAVWAYLNGTLFYSNSSVQDDSIISLTYPTYLYIGWYNFTVQANGSAVNTTIFKIENRAPFVTVFNIGDQWDGSEQTQAYIYLGSGYCGPYYYTPEKNCRDDDMFELKYFLTYPNGTQALVCHWTVNYYNPCTLTFDQPGTYTVTYWVNDTDEEQPMVGTTSQNFVVKDYEIQYVTYSTNAYETSPQNFSITMRYNPDIVVNLTSRFFYNGSDMGLYDFQTKNSSYVENKKQIYVPLIQANNTQVNFYFKNYAYYINGNNSSADSPTYQQNIIYSYIPQNIVLGDNFMEYDDIKPTLNITIYYNNNQTQFSYLWNLTNGTDYKTASGASPTIVNFENYLANESRNLSLTLNISFQGSSRIHVLNKSFTSYMPILTNCSYLSTTQTLSLIVKDEQTQSELSDLNSSYISAYATAQNGRKQRFYDFTNLQNNTICIYPAWATIYANVSTLVTKDNYAITTHVPYQTSVLSNASQTITVYMIPNSIASTVVFTLPGSNYIFVIERLYGSNYVYLRSDYSDFNKKVVMFLKPYDTYYRITVYSSFGQLCFASSGFKVASNTYEISSCSQITTISYPSPWYQQNINYTCSKQDHDNITTITCNFYALDNLDHDFYLVAYRYNEPWGRTLYDNKTVHAISGSLSMDLGEGAYDVYLYAHSDPNYLWSAFVNNKVLIASVELFVFLLIFYSLSCVVGWFNPFIGLLFNIMITFVASFMGLASLPQQAIAGLTILFILSIIFTREWR